MKYFFLFLYLFFSTTVSADQLTTAGEALEKIYPKYSSYEVRQIVLSDAQQEVVSRGAGISFGESHHPQLRLYTVYNAESVSGYALEDTVMGRWGPIHYLAGLSPEGAVIRIAVLDYQEIRGRPVAKNRFLNQYKNKTFRNPLKLHKDIDGITGATVSSAAMTDGIRKVLHIFEMLKDSLRNDV